MYLVVCMYAHKKESVALKTYFVDEVVGYLADKIRYCSTPISEWIRSEECQHSLCIEFPTFHLQEYAYTFRVLCLQSEDCTANLENFSQTNNTSQGIALLKKNKSEKTLNF